MAFHHRSAFQLLKLELNDMDITTDQLLECLQCCPSLITLKLRDMGENSPFTGRLFRTLTLSTSQTAGAVGLRLQDIEFQGSVVSYDGKDSSVDIIEMVLSRWVLATLSKTDGDRMKRFRLHDCSGGSAEGNSTWRQLMLLQEEGLDIDIDVVGRPDASGIEFHYWQ